MTDVDLSVPDSAMHRGTTLVSENMRHKPASSEPCKFCATPTRDKQRTCALCDIMGPVHAKRFRRKIEESSISTS